MPKKDWIKFGTLGQGTGVNGEPGGYGRSLAGDRGLSWPGIKGGSLRKEGGRAFPPWVRTERFYRNPGPKDPYPKGAEEPLRRVLSGEKTGL